MILITLRAMRQDLIIGWTYEAGDWATAEENNLYIKLNPTFPQGVYTGIITYGIVNRPQ